jgi:uncharacterized protein YqgC (DUF456 family)
VDTAIWIVVGLLLAVGFIGSIVPLLPGTTLMLGAVLLQKWLLPDTLTWVVVVWIAVAWFLSVAADFLCTIIGTRLFGGTKWGMAGASGGALVGMFFSLPALLLGTMLGAVIAEKWGAKRTSGDSFKAGAGATIGFLFGTFARFACAMAILMLYGFAVYTALRPPVV